MSKPKVAILSDERTVTLLASRALTELFDVQAFGTTAPGWAKAVAAYGPAGVLLRGMVSAGTGFDVMAALRQEPALAQVPYVVVSSADEAGDKYLAAGAAAFLAIPFSAAQLREAMRKVVRETRVILYVEDSRVLHRMIQPPLVEAGYEVIETYDGREALEVLKSGRKVDLVLSDVEMPELDGFSLCRAVKNDPRLAAVPFLLLTSRDGEESVRAGFSAGADDYLMKPVVVAEMLARIEKFLSPRTARREERILVVEPDANVAHMLERSLETHSLACDVVADGDAAIAWLAEARYSLVIIENRLPGMDGVTLARRLRESPATRDLSIIMTSDSGALGEQVRLRSVGPQSVLVKPFPPERLLAEVERTLANVRHRRQIEAMRGYLSEGAIEAIERRSSQGAVEARAEATFRTILFLDIVGFTTLCETMSPLAVVRFLNEFFDAVVSILTRHGGQIDKFIGDCVMALYDREQSGSRRAVTAALEIVEGLPALRERMGIDVHVRIGINSGAMVIGDIGSTHARRDFTVIGDNVNVASRLQSSAGVDEVYVSETVAEQLGGDFELVGVGHLSVKGRREPVRSYRVERKRR